MRVYCNIIMNEIHQKSQKDEFISPKNHLTPLTKAIYIALAMAKSIAEPGNSTNLSVANSTPNRAFFVRSFRTPQRTPEALRGSERHSMVACGGKGFALCCIPLIAVFQPVTRYRPNPEKFSGSPSEFILGAISDDLSIQSRKPF